MATMDGPRGQTVAVVHGPGEQVTERAIAAWQAALPTRGWDKLYWQGRIVKCRRHGKVISVTKAQSHVAGRGGKSVPGVHGSVSNRIQNKNATEGMQTSEHCATGASLYGLNQRHHFMVLGHLFIFFYNNLADNCMHGTDSSHRQIRGKPQQRKLINDTRKLKHRETSGEVRMQIILKWR